MDQCRGGLLCPLETLRKEIPSSFLLSSFPVQVGEISLSSLLVMTCSSRFITHCPLGSVGSGFCRDEADNVRESTRIY